MERSDNIGTAKLFEEYLPEQMLRVLQPPKIRKIIAGPKGKIDLSEKTDRDIYMSEKLKNYLGAYTFIREYLK
jgi:hypothetical protein